MDHGHDEERSWSRIDNKPAGNYQIETLDMDQMNRGPWTVEEDQLLMNYITKHGEGRWNSLSRSAGLKRTGKSCRLRWLNYLRPDVRRGNITLREQLLILELHSQWGNRWSKMAEYLPGRTDNEIKNYWRTRVQKHAKQFNCDVNSKQFNDIMRQIWMPRLVERIQAESAKSELDNSWNKNNNCMNIVDHEVHDHDHDQLDLPTFDSYNDFGSSQVIINELYDLPDQSSPTTISSDSFKSTQVNSSNISDPAEFGQQYYPDSLISPMGGYFSHGLDFSTTMEHSCDNQYWSDSVQLADTSDNLWNMDDIWFIQ